MSYARKRVVFDTSSLVPMCLHPDRLPAQILRLTFKQHDVYVSSATFYELEQVLKRDKFDAWQPLFTRLAWLHEFKLNVHFVEPVELVDDCRDKKDNQFLDIAIAANADILVSSDVHLLELNPYRNTGIMQLAEFNAVLSFQPLR